jgi:hypothetical protein
MGQQKRLATYERTDSTKAVVLKYFSTHCRLFCAANTVSLFLNEGSFSKASSSPLFLEDENIFQKMARVVPWGIDSFRKKSSIKRALLYTAFLSKVSKVDYPSKAKSSNVHYVAPPIGTVCRISVFIFCE